MRKKFKQKKSLRYNPFNIFGTIHGPKISSNQHRLARKPQSPKSYSSDMSGNQPLSLEKNGMSRQNISVNIQSSDDQVNSIRDIEMDTIEEWPTDVEPPSEQLDNGYSDKVYIDEEEWLDEEGWSDKEEYPNNEKKPFAELDFEHFIETKYAEATRDNHKIFSGEYSPFPNFSFAGLCLYQRYAHLSRSKFETLLRFLRHPSFQVTDLPTSYKMVQRYLSDLPRIPIYMRDLPHHKKKDPTSLTHTSRAYYHHPSDILKRVLNTQSLKDTMHFGHAIYSNKKSELWHGHIWAESPIFSSGKFFANNEEFFLGDFISFRNDNGSINHGRITQIWQSDGCPQGELMIGVQKIIKLSKLSNSIKRELDNSIPHVCFLVEEPTIIQVHFILGHTQFVFAKEDDTDTEHYTSKKNIITDIIYQHPTSKKMLTRSCHLRHILPFENFFPDHPPRQMPTLNISLVIFYDEMGAFRNVYHALGGCYLSIGNLPVRLRQKLRNNMLLGFVPFGCTFEDFIIPFIKDLASLQKGEIWLVNGVEHWVVAGLGVIISDLPQGNKLASIKNHNAIFGCRFCLASNDQLKDIEFDHLLHGRYNHITESLISTLREHVTESTAKKFSAKYGISMATWRDKNPLEYLRFNQHCQIPLDPSHVLFQNIDRLLIESTINLLSSQGKKHLRDLLLCIKLPPSWKRFQDPTKYLGSYFFSDCARFVMIGPALIHMLKNEDFSSHAIDSIRARLELQRSSLVLREIVKCWVMAARVGVCAFASELSSYNNLDECLQNFAKQILHVFPEQFAHRPNFHALTHLSVAARAFGTLRNISASAGEMTHRIHKQEVPHTNCHDLPRDLVLRESQSQTLRFISEDCPCDERENSVNPGYGRGLIDILRLGLFDDVYISAKEKVAQVTDFTNEDDTAKLQSGHADFSNIVLLGKSIQREDVKKIGLSQFLDRKQRGELMKAYEDAKVDTLITERERKVSYYKGVTYSVRGKARHPNDVDLVELDEDMDDISQNQVTVKIGNIVEFILDDASDGKGYARVIAITRHQNFVFFALRWIMETGSQHPQLGLREFRETNIFEYACYHPLMLVDNQRFVDSVYFVELDGKLFLNDWIFSAV